MINLMLGDCLERMKELDDNSIDLVLTDPPYGTTQAKWDSIIPLEPMWKELDRIVKPNGVMVFMSQQPFTTTLIASNKSLFKYCWIWNKNLTSGHLSSGHRPLTGHEDIVIFYNKTPIYNPQKIKKIKKSQKRMSGSNSVLYGKHKKVITGGSYYKHPNTVISAISCVPRSSKIRFHPTQKPVPLMGYLIRTYTNEGRTVLDFAMGSGTTGVACKVLNRSFVGIELDEEYFEIAKNRIGK